MISRRVTDDRLAALKDDLLLALQRIQLSLEEYRHDRSQPTPLPAMIAAIDEIRGPFAALEHRNAVALLDEMRLLAMGLIKGRALSCDPLVLQDAAACLTGYLESCLEPGPSSDDELVKMTETLRRLRQQDLPSTTLKTPPPSFPESTRGLLDGLKRLRDTIAVDLDGTTEQPEAWALLQRELQPIHHLLAGQEWTRAALISERLGRIAGALSVGAEHYRLLATSLCGQILAALCHYLEPLGSERPAPAAVLSEAEDHLSQLETLLELPSLFQLAGSPSEFSDTQPAKRFEEALPLFDFALDAFETSAKPPAAKAFDLAVEPARPDEPPSIDLSQLDFGDRLDFLEDFRPPVVEKKVDLMDLLKMEDADPEFVEVFLDEARGELTTIREQLVHWRENLQDRDVLTTIRRAFHTLKGSGRMVGAMVIGDFAWEYENLLNQVLSGNLSGKPAICDAVAEAVSVLAPLVGEIPPRGDELEALPALIGRARALLQVEQAEPVTAPPKPIEPGIAPTAVEPITLPKPVESAPVKATTAPPSLPAATPPAEPLSARLAMEIDPEFLEVFLEEAREELDNIRKQSAIWQRNLADRQAAASIRRAFHTLKGSGRVVGASELGDFAWEFESLFNHILNGTLPPSSAVAGLIGEVADVLQPLIDKAPLTAEIQSTMAALIARAQAFIQDAEEDISLTLAEALETAEPIKPVKAAEPSKPVETIEPITPVEAIKTASVVIAPVEVAPPLEAGPPVVPEVLVTAGVDPELAEVFQYEAAEILDASDLILQRLATEDADHTVLLNDLRRNMHTLKGGSRMSGLMSIGDLAHAAESVLDALGKGASQAPQVVIDTLQQTLDSFNRMVMEAARGANPAAATDMIGGLHRLADAIAAGVAEAALPPLGLDIEPALADSLSKRRIAPRLPEAPAFKAMTELDQELVQVFRAEASEILDSSDVILQRLRDDPSSAELLNNLRREMHTLKGSSRMAGFMTVGDLAHAAESILDALGKGALEGSPGVHDLIQRTMDRLHQMLAGILSGEQLPPQQALIEELQGVLGAKRVEPSKPQAPVITATLTTVPITAQTARPAERPAPAPADNIRVSSTLLTSLVNQMGESSIFRARVDQGVSAMSFNLNELEQTIARLRRQVGNLATQAEARIQSRHDQEDAKSHQQEFDPLELDRFTELQQVSRSLMEIADDLSNIGNTLGDHAREVTSLLDQQSKVNKEIQQGLMRTGMVRFGSIVSRLRRVARQSAQELGKRAELLVGGEDAEVDRNVLENMIAPLEHMMRNSLAHGIEPPELRRERGKPEIGTISLSLRREGAELVIELGDDGHGLNFEAIRAKGEEKGLLLPDQPASEEELIGLLLRPGFSTATSVTQISGRGVGMDVVNEAIRAMRGALLIQTEAGRGTRFIVRLPFSLAVTQALLAQIGDTLFAIPLLSIELVTRLKESDYQRYLAGEPVEHQYGERSYPIHNLGLLTGSGHVQPFDEVSDRRPPALLFRSAEASAALQVETVLGNREIIVKPVGPQFNGVPGISGATMLGDGRVVVVLELAALVRNIGSQTQKQSESRALRMARQEIRQERINIMVIDDSITMRKVTGRILERHNIGVVTAKDGLDAVAMLQTQIPDLAILDIEMPRMDGFEVLAHVRNQPNLRDLPIIMVTSRGGDKHRERAMKLGVNDYLTKPYQEDQLMQSIRAILGERAQGLIT